ncbi:MAG: hypothetical protein NHB32_06880 [Fischerella sp. CENA71]|nr:hypothetical protein [Fischerella sp. CENA71]
MTFDEHEFENEATCLEKVLFEGNPQDRTFRFFKLFDKPRDLSLLVGQRS